MQLGKLPLYQLSYTRISLKTIPNNLDLQPFLLGKSPALQTIGWKHESAIQVGEICDENSASVTFTRSVVLGSMQFESHVRRVAMKQSWRLPRLAPNFQALAKDASRIRSRVRLPCMLKG